MAPTKKAREILRNVAREIEGLASGLNKNFDHALELLQSCEGAIIVMGNGKSIPVGEKLVSSFRSAGRSACLLNPVDAFYGEAASVSARDVVLIISSGEDADEIIRIIPWLKTKKVKIIAVTPVARGGLARSADVLLTSAIATGSEDGLISYTTCLTALAVGDLLGLCMIHQQDIEHERAPASASDAREAIYTIGDLVATRPSNPTVPWDTIFKDALLELTSKGLGAISIVDDDGKLLGIITDGDVRRLLQRSQGSLTRIFLLNVDSVMIKNPKHIFAKKTLTEALTIMEDNAITVLPVVDDDMKPVGMIHLHDLVQLGLLRRDSNGAGTKKTAKKTKKKKTAGSRSEKKGKTAKKKKLH